VKTNREIKKLLIEWLMAEYDELDATQQICFAEIERQKVELINVVYENGASDKVLIINGKIHQVNEKTN
jgi:hypothetical protein